MAAQITTGHEAGVQVISVNGDEETSRQVIGLGQDNDTPKLEAQGMERAPCYVISATTGAAVAQVATSPEALQQQLQDEMVMSGATSSSSRRLVVVHGLPTGFVPTLCTNLGMDPDLIRALAGRKRYKSKTPKKPRSVKGATSDSCTAATVVSYEYPLLLGGEGARAFYNDIGGEDYDEVYGQTRDELVRPLLCSLSSSGGDEVAFCRVTVWQGERNTVLFLDRPSWRGTSSPNRESLGEADTLEKQVQECISSEESMESFTSTVEAMIHEHWLEFMDALQPGMDNTSDNAMSLAWEIQKRLEANLQASSSGGAPGFQAYSAARPNWQALLDRSERHRRLAFDIASLKSRIERTVAWPPEPMEKPGRAPGGGGMTPSRYLADEVQQESLQTEENQRSLDRVSYLGGVLLPLSIVSGILSMGDTFGPGGDLFYVFWAAGVPLTVMTLLVIYADSIRREVVYVQTSHKGGDSSSDDASSDHNSAEGGGDETWRRWNRVGNTEELQVTVSMPDLESGIAATVPYTEQIPITEPISAAPPAPSSPYPRLDKEEAAASVAGSEPTMAVLEPRFGRRKRPHDNKGGGGGGTWERRELGWMGAAMCALQLSELKRQKRPPPRTVGGRLESGFRTTPRVTPRTTPRI